MRLGRWIVGAVAAAAVGLVLVLAQRARALARSEAALTTAAPPGAKPPGRS